MNHPRVPGQFQSSCREAACSLRTRAVDVLVASSRLSPRCRQVVELMAAGVRRENLACAMGVEETTVRSHIREVLRRTGVDRIDRLAWRLLQIVDDIVADDIVADATRRESGPARPMPESVTGPRDTIPRDEVQPPS